MTEPYKPLFVTGIGTNVGKTIVSAVLCQQMNCDYWKPVQAGDLTHTDSMVVEQLISNTQTKIHQEAFRLQLAASPHQSAKEEGLEIFPEDLQIPTHYNTLLIEGAGGLFVPLSPAYLMIDLIQQVDAEVVLVARDYLGCINHTLLSIHALRSQHIPLKHVVFNGTFNPATAEAIVSRLPAGTTHSHLPEFTTLTKSAIAAAPIQIQSFIPDLQKI